MALPHILFVTEKWTDLDPNKPLTNHQHNLFGSLETSGLATHHCIYYDEYYYNHNKILDEDLINLIDKEKFDAVFITPLPICSFNPSKETYEKIAQRTKLVFVWADGVHFMNYAEQMIPYATLMILWDTDRAWSQGTKFLHLWTPQDPRIYYDPELERDIDVSFIGNYEYLDRNRYIKYLKDNNINITLAGGRNQEKILTVEEYANFFKRSRISLNFSITSTGQPQLKGRIFEAMSCGSMLMESVNEINWIKRWYMPEIDYIPFTNEVDLKDKINYYLNHKEECCTIAKNGWRRTMNNYNNTTWWETVLYTIGLIA